MSKDINDVKRPSRKNQIQISDEALYLSETTFPAANQINQIRNALEHKSLKIVDGFGYEISQKYYDPKNTLDEVIKARENLHSSSSEYQVLNESIEEKIGCGPST